MGFLSAITAIFLVGTVLSATLPTIPSPSGPYGVGLQTAELINNALLDPYAPSNVSRRIMVSAFYPTSRGTSCKQTKYPYMPPATAQVYDTMYAPVGLPNGTFEAIGMSLCNPTATTSDRGRPRRQSHPVALFSPGLGNSRLIYSVTAASLAAQGFIVFTIDHPYDAPIVEFPDGSTVPAVDIDTKDQIVAALKTRTKDLLFVAEQLHNATFTRTILNGLYGTPDLSRVFACGHSLGGATAAGAMLKNSNSSIRAGINLDGTLFGDVTTVGLNKPFAMLSHEGKNLTSDPSWAETWPRLNNSKIAATVRGTQHGSFTDFPVLVDVLGLRDALGDGASELVGTVSGRQMMELLSGFASAFFRFAGGQTRSAALERALGQFSEVEVLDSVLRPQTEHLSNA
ncbi:uncharacterized protein HMPREF1541_11045 [Cyphellophora europaea CBS 101466]|uniref:1-alkyl-2-acetylglycerophosphocholine esterase n=1 Tax=Cyphellophora europaea (strain CBS 101466) TaxID=1220924 RepID=W2S7N6_CYPE1|nr:uncharacterized protein HMPREF1541_11045 [Cyphellophora europaea CBS 101466]ETN43914.1 hypothetical protein HMPREF1541_11045 [Cyphellophora europaea CBS 101466]